jgi:hypothetical protein
MFVDILISFPHCLTWHRQPIDEGLNGNPLQEKRNTSEIENFASAQERRDGKLGYEG